MKGIGLNIQYVQIPVCGLPAGYIQDKSKGIAFIYEPQFSIWIHRGSGIKKYPAFEHIAVQVSYHAARISQ